MQEHSETTMTIEEAEALLTKRGIAIGTTVEEAAAAIEQLGFSVEYPSEPPMGHQIVRVRPPAEYQGVPLSGKSSVAVDITQVDSAEPDIVNAVDSQWSARDALVRAFAQCLQSIEAEMATSKASTQS